jgi:hypothetical protein
VFANATKAIEAEEKKSEPKVWPPGSEWRQPKHMRAPQTVKENGT